MQTALLTKQTFSSAAVKDELAHIGNWWLRHAPDPDYRGFYGEIDYFGKPLPTSPKGCVLNTRILWFFSEIAGMTGSSQYLAQAKASYKWIAQNLRDDIYDGLLWQVDASGKLVDGKKQTYAQCFGIYALSSYYQLTGDKVALDLAITCFNLVEQYARDKDAGGYVEACSRDWQAVDDHRLSDKDLNFPKSMNTHLHVLEAYSALYRVYPKPEVEEALRHVLKVFIEHIVCHESYHLKLFFDMAWQNHSATYSFGHDIEASWLLWEAALSLGDQQVMQQVKQVSVKLAQVCLDEAIGEQGQVCDDFELASLHRDERSYWWVQAEALVGFLNAYLLTSDQKFFQVCQPIWQFIQDYHIDRENGEWHWLASCDQEPNHYIYKAGFWKGPYHNGRAMMELIELFKQVGG